MCRAGRQQDGRGAFHPKAAVPPLMGTLFMAVMIATCSGSKGLPSNGKLALLRDPGYLPALARYLTAFAIVARAYSFLTKILKR